MARAARPQRLLTRLKAAGAGGLKMLERTASRRALQARKVFHSQSQTILKIRLET
jgi:hypothetical protein